MGIFTELFNTNFPLDRPVAIDTTGTIIPWQKFQSDVGALYARLSKSCYERWALCFEDSYWFAVSVFSLAISGKEIVLPNNIRSKSALNDIIEHFDAILSDLTLGVECDVWKPESGDKDTDLPSCSLDDVKITLFTSGTTGVASKIHKTFKMLDKEISVLGGLFGAELLNCEVFGTVSHQHIYGLLFRILLPLSLGSPFSSKMLEYPDQVSSKSSRNRILVSSPALLKRLTMEKLNVGYRKVFSSGGPLPYESAQQCFDLFGNLPVEVYGSSETGGIAWREQTSVDKAWLPFPGIYIRSDKEGRLEIKSPYLEDENWFLTDDLVKILPGGKFQLLGRSDRVVKISEKRISLIEVEQRLQCCPEIEEAVVVPLESGIRLEIGAVVVLSCEGAALLSHEGRRVFWTSIKQALRNYIEPVGLPRKFRVVDQLPVNSQGKHEIDRLKELFL